MKYINATLIVVLSWSVAAREIDHYRDYQDRPIEYRDPIPARHQARKDVAFVLDGPVSPLVGCGRSMTMRLINPTASPIYFVGRDKPFTNRQLLSDGVWQTPSKRPGCGTGIKTYVIPPGHSIAVQLWITDPSPIREGVRYSQPRFSLFNLGDRVEREVWSDPIEVATPVETKKQRGHSALFR